MLVAATVDVTVSCIAGEVDAGLLLEELDEHLEVGDLSLQLPHQLALHLQRVHDLAHRHVHRGPQLVL